MNANVIGATRIENIFESKLRENFAAITGTMAPKKVEDVVKGLEEHFASSAFKKSDLAQCDICAGWSALVEGIESCPYCDDQSEARATAPAAADIPVVKAELVEEEEPMRLDESPIDALALQDAGVELEASVGKGGRKKLSSAEIVEAKKVTRAPAAPKPSAPVLTLIGAGGRPALTEKQLDEELARYREAASAMGVSSYLVGLSIVRLRDHLWQQRLVEGKPKYKSWNQYVAEELEISTSLANRMIRVVQNFTQDQFVKFGVQVLKVLVAAPKEEHELLLAQAEKGATTRELEAEVRKIRDNNGIAVIETGTTEENKKKGRSSPSAATTAAAATARKKETAAITLGMKGEQATVRFLARTKPGEPERAAKTIEDQPYAVLECINGVNLYIAIKVRPTGEWEAKLTAKREEPVEG
jgi:hypothetical protein